MGNETILYYVTKEFLMKNRESNTLNRNKEDSRNKEHNRNKEDGRHKEYGRYKGKKFRRKEAPFFLIEQDNIRICVIPVEEKPRKRQQKKWMKTIPSEFLASDVMMQPQARQRLWQQDAQAQATEPLQEIEPVLWSIAQKILSEDVYKGSRQPKANTTMQNRGCMTGRSSMRAESHMRGGSHRYENVVLLLGNSMFPEQQMQRFEQMMQPFFIYLNHLTIFFSAAEEDKERFEEAIAEYTEEFYYEYGLVSQLVYSPVQKMERRKKELFLQKRPEGTLFLDYGYQGEFLWKLMKEKDIYLDMTSSEKKENLIKRKYTEVFCLSPLKYLDTVVKSGYDKLVNLYK